MTNGSSKQQQQQQLHRKTQSSSRTLYTRMYMYLVRIYSAEIAILEVHYYRYFHTGMLRRATTKHRFFTCVFVIAILVLSAISRTARRNRYHKVTSFG